MYFFNVEVSPINHVNFTLILCIFIIDSEDVSNMFITKSAATIALDLDKKCLYTLINVDNLFIFIKVEPKN